MEIQNINHICFSCSDLKTSIGFYQNVLKGKLLVSGRTTAYFNIGGLWIALNEQKDIDRETRNPSYTHTAFSISEHEYSEWYHHLKDHDVNILNGRERNQKDKQSIYFTDPDHHILELHTGTLEDRLSYYKKDKAHMVFYND